MKTVFEVEVYDYVVVVCTATEEFQDSSGCEPTSDFSTYGDSRKIVIIASELWGEDMRDIRWLSSLMHECNHAAMFIFKHRNLYMSCDHDEAFCYLADYIFSRALTGLAKLKHNDNFEGKI